MLIETMSIKFNDEVIILNDKKLVLSQSKQFDCFRLIIISKSIDLTESRRQIRKSITSKNQYVAQRARNVYIAIMTQLEVSFDFSIAAQIINLKEKDVKRWNQRLQWQKDHSNWELRFVQLNLDHLKLMIFTDVSFANVDFHSQIEYVVCLIDEQKANLIYWFFIKCKRITRSVLTAELYAMTNDFDIESIIKTILKRILNIFILLIICTNFKFLYDCLVKLRTTMKKRLMIDLMCFRQSYERREIIKI